MEGKINKIVGEAKKDKKIIAVALFGSFLKRKGRDIDICIFMNKNTSNKEATEKRIRFLGEFGDKLDINIFHQLPIYIRIRIIKDGKILFVRDEDVLYKTAFDTIKEFDSYKKLYSMYLNKVKNGPRKSALKI